MLLLNQLEPILVYFLKLFPVLLPHLIGFKEFLHGQRVGLLEEFLIELYPFGEIGEDGEDFLFVSCVEGAGGLEEFEAGQIAVVGFGREGEVQFVGGGLGGGELGVLLRHPQ